MSLRNTGRPYADDTILTHYQWYSICKKNTFLTYINALFGQRGFDFDDTMYPYTTTIGIVVQ